jgi:hypothetical protein
LSFATVVRIRHTFPDASRREKIEMATVKAMAGHATDARHFLYSQGVDVDEQVAASTTVVAAYSTARQK